MGVDGICVVVAENCLKHKELGAKKNGIYPMQGSAGGVYLTYCDFAVGGGGWTLVASVHEDNIKAKCNTKDLWTNTNGNNGDLIHDPYVV